MYFQAKNTLKSNFNYIPKQALSQVVFMIVAEVLVVKWWC